MKQIQTRFENINRKTAEFSVKRKHDESAEDEEELLEVGSSHKKSLCDEYGCINYLPVNYPEGKTEETQECKKNILIGKYSLGETNEVEELMTNTFFSQRKDILSKNATTYLQPSCGMASSVSRNRYVYTLLEVDQHQD